MTETHERTPPGRSLRRLRQEFNADAPASLLTGNRSITSVGRDLDLVGTNLPNGVRLARIDRAINRGWGPLCELVP